MGGLDSRWGCFRTEGYAEEQHNKLSSLEAHHRLNQGVAFDMPQGLSSSGHLFTGIMLMGDAEVLSRASTKTTWPMLRRARLWLGAVCVATVIASFSTSLLSFDAMLMDWMRANRMGHYTDVALIITALGSTPVALAAVFFGAVCLLAKRWWFDLWLLLLVVVGGTQLNSPLKDLFDRPRPIFPDPVLTFNGSGFPSGHAMTATVLCGACVLIVARHEPRRTRRFGAITGAIAVVVIVAATRVYLGAHYFTDVLGGVAFGCLWLTVSDAAICWLEHRSK